MLKPAGTGDETSPTMCTENCGRLEPPDVRELIAGFTDMAESAFGFLEREFRLQAQPVAVSQWAGAAWSPVSPAGAGYPFLAHQDFTGPDHGVRLRYGERDYRLELELEQGGCRRPLTGWLAALGVESVPDWGVATVAALTFHGARLAGVLRTHYADLRRVDPADVGRERDLGRARELANAAFAAQEYERYAGLMEPFEAVITATERSKLAFARAKLA